MCPVLEVAIVPRSAASALVIGAGLAVPSHPPVRRRQSAAPLGGARGKRTTGIEPATSGLEAEKDLSAHRPALPRARVRDYTAARKRLVDGHSGTDPSSPSPHPSNISPTARLRVRHGCRDDQEQLDDRDQQEHPPASLRFLLHRSRKVSSAGSISKRQTKITQSICVTPILGLSARPVFRATGDAPRVDGDSRA